MVREEALRYLPWAALTALPGVLAFQMDGVFIGATCSRGHAQLMLVSFTLYLVALFTLAEAFWQSRAVGGDARLPARRGLSFCWPSCHCAPLGTFPA